MPYADKARAKESNRARYLRNRVLKGRPSLETRFWSFVAPMTDDRGCWEWSGSLNNKGYGEIANGRTALAHRVSYELNVGFIPAGLSLDHLCRNPSCVNPRHLEPVTHAENIRRGNPGKKKTHCKRGHGLVAGNTYANRRGVQCRTCAIDRSKKRHADAKLLPNPFEFEVIG